MDMIDLPFFARPNEREAGLKKLVVVRPTSIVDKTDIRVVARCLAPVTSLKRSLFRRRIVFGRCPTGRRCGRRAAEPCQPHGVDHVRTFVKLFIASTTPSL